MNSPARAENCSNPAPGFGHAILSTELAPTLAAGAAAAVAACTVAALDDATTEEPVEGEDGAGFTAGAL